VILDDAPHLYIRQREGLCEILEPFGFHDGLVIDLSVEVRDGPIGSNRSRLDPMNAPSLFDEGNFDVRLLSPFLRQNLNAHIVVLVPVPAVISIHLPVQIDCRRAGRFRDAGHS